jgi:hypothetical protein
VAYSERARSIRRCSGTTKSGRPCKAYAKWGAPDRRCSMHATCFSPVQGRPPCGCPAYGFPHQAGGGLCLWPDAPTHTHPKPAGVARFPWPVIKALREMVPRMPDPKKSRIAGRDARDFVPARSVEPLDRG